MRKSDAMQLKRQETDTFDTPTDLRHDAITEISSGLRQLLADVFALYVKTKNFHWHMGEPIFVITTCCSTSNPHKSLR
jgi:starvation-inducible DNA-binding protein